MEEAKKGVDLSHLVGKYLTFRLKNEEYAIPITIVREIVGMLDITPVPNTPPHVKGVVNLRGKIIPVIDLKVRLGLEETEYTRETCIVVLEIDEALVGAIVDSVNEVLDLSLEHLQEPPQLGSSETEFILAMANLEDRVIILMDVKGMLEEEDLGVVASAG